MQQRKSPSMQKFTASYRYTVFKFVKCFRMISKDNEYILLVSLLPQSSLLIYSLCQRVGLATTGNGVTSS